MSSRSLGRDRRVFRCRDSRPATVTMKTVEVNECARTLKATLSLRNPLCTGDPLSPAHVRQRQQALLAQSLRTNEGSEAGECKYKGHVGWALDGHGSELVGVQGTQGGALIQSSSAAQGTHPCGSATAIGETSFCRNPASSGREENAGVGSGVAPRVPQSAMRPCATQLVMGCYAAAHLVADGALLFQIWTATFTGPSVRLIYILI
jgi:hypothetical protein